MNDLNLFTCTLGEAVGWNRDHPHDFQTITALIDENASKYPDRLAVAFPAADSVRSSTKDSFTFAELRTYSIAAGTTLREQLKSRGVAETSTVGLLCASTPDTLLVWLGLHQLGLRVLMIAPELQPSAVEHLCTACETSVIITDSFNSSKFSEDGSLTRLEITDVTKGLTRTSRPPVTSNFKQPTVRSEDVAIFFHTSGTSSGRPKDIPMSHQAAVGALPCLADQADRVVYSTTPLYHAGVVDCFRSWTSASTIYLFPGYMPITGENIMQSIKVVTDRSWPTIQYFTSVPYILSRELDRPDGIDFLRNLSAVGTGGAALSPDIGTRLINQGINLVSRYGSSECGFLLSSKRNYSSDKDGAYLRDQVHDPSLYVFETFGDDGLSQLIVKPGWPALGKTNREDGSYATADLFEPHPHIPHAWRYHSRADAQITLINGKKFDPAPVEDRICAALPGHVQGAMIFGNDQGYPGILVLSSPSSEKGANVDEEIKKRIEEANTQSPKHAQIQKHMVVIIGADESAKRPLPRSSKGTLLRAQAEKMWAAEIIHAYEAKIPVRSRRQITDENVLSELRELFTDDLGYEVNPTRDLFAQGVDSVACARLRTMIQQMFLQNKGKQMPLNIIYEEGTLEKLATYIIDQRADRSTTKNVDDETESLMKKWTAQYGTPFVEPLEQPSESHKEKVVVLTGATGLLGAHILGFLRDDPSVTKVFCFLRASKPFSAHERASKSLENRGLKGLPAFEESGWMDAEIVCLPCRLPEPKMGLSEAEYTRIAAEVTHIIHSAWYVNFSLRLESFEDHIIGTSNLLNLRNASKNAAAQMTFVSSVAAVDRMEPSSSGTVRAIEEKATRNPRDASILGYARSKWVAEQLCLPQEHRKQHDMIKVVRVGQMCGNEQGIWNSSEAYPIMLSAAKITGCLPDLTGESLNWLRADLAAKSVLELAFSSAPKKGNGSADERDEIYHVSNKHRQPSWSQMLQWIQEHTKEKIEIVSPDQWLARLEEALKDHQHPAQALFHWWKEANLGSNEQSMAGLPTIFDTAHAESMSETMRHVKPVSESEVLRMWGWIQGHVGEDA